MLAQTMPSDDIPTSATPMISSEGATHIVVRVEISQALLVGCGDCSNSSSRYLNAGAATDDTRVLRCQ
jgi:hypothetical protein